MDTTVLFLEHQFFSSLSDLIIKTTFFCKAHTFADETVYKELEPKVS